MPLTVKVKAGPPAATELGLMLVSTGAAAETTQAESLGRSLRRGLSTVRDLNCKVEGIRSQKEFPLRTPVDGSQR